MANQSNAKSPNRLMIYMIAAFLFMVAGAFVYSSQTETLEQCRALYDATKLDLYSGN